MRIFDSPQGTDEWKKERAGHFTASNFSSLFMAKSTKGYQEAINQVVFERITGELPESYSNDYMARGNELEPVARETYELMTFNKVKQVGFMELDEWAGASADGLIGENGHIEIKCPKWNTLIGYMLDDIVPKDYMIQMQGQMYVSGRQWCDFFVYHPKLKPILKRVPRDEKMISEIKEKIEDAVAEAKKRINKITNI